MFTIELPDKMKELVELGMAREGIATPGEFLEILLVRHNHWWDETPIGEELESELLKGLEGEPIEFTPETWESFKEELRLSAESQSDHAKAVGA